MKISKEIKVGALAIITIVAFLIGISYLRGRSVLADINIYKASFENVNGLTKGSPVLYKGYKVGQVQAIKYQEGSGDLEVSFDVDKSIPVPKDSRVVIKSADLMGIGGMQMALMPGKSSQLAENEAFLKSELDSGPIGELTDQISEVAEMTTTVENSINELVTTFNDAFGNGSDSKIGKITQNIEELSSNLAADSKKLGPILNDVKTVTGDIGYVVDSIRNDPNLKRMMTNAADASENFNKTSKDAVVLVANANSAIHKVDSIVTKINDGEGSIGRLLNDDQLYKDLDEAVVDLDLLLEDLRNNPKRYIHFSVFGRKNKGPKPPEAINDDNTNRNIGGDSDE